MIPTFDLHDEAFYIWRRAGVRGAPLLHIDAHHDAARDPDWKAIDIGNYVRAAIRGGIIGAVRWVVPDPMWVDAGTREILLGEIEDVAEPPIAVASDGARATVEGVDAWMGPMAAVPRSSERVLLDIDADYLLTARYEEHRTAEPLAIPWCWPDALVARIAKIGVVPLVTTVASSVTGGFTPLEWAHLAREIAARIEGIPPPPCFAQLRRAAEVRGQGDVSGALDACRAAVAECPREAAGHFHFAQALQAVDRLTEARDACARARSLDPFYAHPFATRGPYLLRRERLGEAAAAFASALDLDPSDAHAQLGLAMVAVREGRYEAARLAAERSLSGAPDAVDGWRTLGEAAARLGDRRAAIRAYERALALALRGAPPLRGPWSSNPDGRLLDPRHWDDHAALAALHEALGDGDAATAHHRMAAAGAPETFGRPFGGVLPS